MRLAILMASCAVLAACSPPAAEAPTAPAEAVPAVLAGTDLAQPIMALGTEPFWSVAVTAQNLILTEVDQAAQTASNPGPVVQGTTAVFRSVTAAGAPMVLTLIATECSDGMSDRTYPLTASVELGERTLHGCAASRAFLDALPKP